MLCSLLNPFSAAPSCRKKKHPKKPTKQKNPKPKTQPKSLFQPWGFHSQPDFKKQESTDAFGLSPSEHPKLIFLFFSFPQFTGSSLALSQVSEHAVTLLGFL